VYLGLVIFPDVDHTLRPFPHNLLIDGWFRWDGGHYFAIARDGYQPIADSAQQRTNFWPLFPLLVRAVSWGIGNDSTWSILALALGNVTDWHHLATGTFESIAIINLVFGVLALFLCLVGFRRFGTAAGTWGVVTMLVLLRIWASAGRCAAVVWPAYVGLALLTRGRPILYQGIVAILCLLQALLAFWFAHGHWVA